MTPVYFGPIISTTAGDTYTVRTEHLYEMTTGTWDPMVTWPTTSHDPERSRSWHCM